MSLFHVQGLVAVDELVRDGVAHAAARRGLDLAVDGPVALLLPTRRPAAQAQSAQRRRGAGGA